ncbi:hypothetical protein ACP70R_010327 [Stipagrostis hirtigluma subsp. patula]
MEAIEGNHVEGAVLWLAQSIVASLLLGKLAAWLRQVGLADDAEKLRSEIERVEAVVGAAKGRAAGNRPLARSLGRLKELLYDADDLVDELDYCRLQHQVEGVTLAPAIELEGTDGDGAEQVDASRNNAGMPSSSDRKKRSKAWEEFRVTETVDGKPAKAECPLSHSEAGDGAPNGSTVATRHSDSIKRIRADEVSATNRTANTHPWNKTEFSTKIQQMAHQLQEFLSEVLKLYVSDSVVSSNPYRSTTADARRRTSSIAQSKIYGRVAEKNYIINLIGNKSDSITVLPIVGIGGVGKTTLAQLVYNDPIVKSQFELLIWVWVSRNFDEVRITREMLDFVSQEKHDRKHERMCSFAKLQETLIGCITAKRFLLILDDIWDNINGHTWNKLFAPMQSDNVKGNVIIMTTRKLSIAKAIGTVTPIKLDALQTDDFHLLFQACAFGDDTYKGHSSLNRIAGQIEEKLHGNPLAAETAGMLLRDNLTIDHWSSTLKKETWKSLHLSNGIMDTLRLSYDELPYSLQQCLVYCSIFPNNHRFLSNELVCIWISQGFVKCDHSNERLEDIGRDYLTDLVNLGFFELDESYKPTPGDQTCYFMPVLMLDFVRLVSRTECAVIDGLKWNEMLPSIHHLSIFTDSAYHEDQRGNILRNEKFEEKLRSAVTSLRKLRTLLLIGKYDVSLFLLFQDIFKKAQHLRMLHISATYAGFDFILHKLITSTHLRYLKLEIRGSGEDLPIRLNKSYHLQVLDVGQPIVLNSMNGLVNMRHLAVEKGANFMDQNSICFGIAQLRQMNELVQLGVYQLQNVNASEACVAKLRDKQHLEKLHLSWKYNLSQDGYDNDTILPFSRGTVTQYLNHLGTNCQSSQQYDSLRARDVLESLEPHHNLKHLQISGYRSATFPGWLGTSVTCLRTLHFEDCGEWQTLSFLGSLPFLTKLKLRNMQKLMEVWIPTLEELVLIEMPKLEVCSCSSVRGMNSSLRVLKIERCYVLEAFPLFESCEKLKIEHKSWLPRLNELTVDYCPRLNVSNPLPPSSNTCKLSITRVSTLPTMKGSSNGQFTIGSKAWFRVDEYSHELKKLDDQILSFHNLMALTRLEIVGCQNLSWISLKGFRQLISLKCLEIGRCESLFSSYVVPEDIHEDMTDANFNALPSLEQLRITSCGITGKWLSVLLQHVGTLEELHLQSCQQIKGLLIEGKELSLSNLTSGPHASTPPDEFPIIPSNLIPSLKSMYVGDCDGLTFLSEEGFSGFTSLEKLTISDCPKLISSLVHKDENDDRTNGTWLLPRSLCELTIDHSPETLHPCFPGNLTALKKLVLWGSPVLKSLELHSCTALEELEIKHMSWLEALEGFESLGGLRHLKLSDISGLNSLQLRSCAALEELEIIECESLEALEGLESLACLRNLEVLDWPRLLPCLERLLRQGYELCRRLERLGTDHCSLLTTSICKNLTSLQCLEFHGTEVTGLTDGQERVLQLLTSLQELRFVFCDNLQYLPVSLHSLPSLKMLQIIHCERISRLPEKGLPPSLEELEIRWCSSDLTEQCRALATSKLRVKINRVYVN